MQPERWMSVVGYEGLYEVSNTGDVRNANTKKSIVQTFVNGYKRVNLWKHNKMKTKRVHRLVAEAFVPNPEGKPVINHKDGVKTNNSIDNLEWVTSSENNKHAIDSKLRTPNCEQAINARKKPVIIDHCLTFESITAAAKYLGCRTSVASGALRAGRTVRGHEIEYAA